jgi:glycerate 2-kinase
LSAEQLTALYLGVAGAVDGARLVAEALAGDQTGRGAHVLAVGKVALPMFEGFTSVAGDPPGALVITADGDSAPIRPGLRILRADHPQPSARSEAAAGAALEFVGGLGPGDRLVVLLSGGGSALLAAPAPGLTLEEKRDLVSAVARAGATIAELNTVRKHLSAVKGGQLALATAAPTAVLALSDVVGDDPATIASGPFSADPTTFAQALALVERLSPQAAGPARARLERGAAGLEPETPAPGDPRLGHVSYRILAGPERVLALARRQIAQAGLTADLLSRNTEDAVPTLAAAYAMRARRELGRGPRILVGNGEPRIVVNGPGRGGRSTHLALLLARELAGLPVAFLAAGTDRHDGTAGGSGAVIDGRTWERALAGGLDPAGALDRCDSATTLEALGCLVRGPGRSNLLDLHLMAIDA